MLRMRFLALASLAIALLPMTAGAQSDSMTRIERTPAYVLSLSIGPLESMDMSHSMGEGGDMAMGHDDASMMSHENMTDQSMAVNHRLDVQITRADTGAVVDDVNPTIRITDKTTGESRDLPEVMGAGMSTDFHYGQNVWLPDGTYHVTVLVNPGDTAMFRDITVMDHSMDMGMHDMGPHPPTAP
jgi:hypothetical protein